ncbi:MAG: MFS transporter [Myxococcaceae bacterium]
MEPHLAPVARTAPWLFGVLRMSFGFTAAVAGILVPYLLRQHGTPVDRIAGVVAVAMLPMVWAFLYSPLADTGLRRRSWVLLSSSAAGLAAAAAILGVDGSLAVLTSLLFVSVAAAGLNAAAVGGLLTHVSESARGRASGWSQAGNIGAGAVGGGVLIWLADHAPPWSVALVIFTAILLPSLAALLIEEAAPARRALGPLLRALFHDIREMALSKRTWLGLLFFLSPAGSFAVSNLISGLGPDYHASSNAVVWVVGIGGGVLATLGSFLGGAIADRVNRMAAYALVALFGAVVAAYLALGPATAFTYALGYSAYALASGVSYCLFTALILDVVGQRRQAAATAFSLLNASGNIAITYMLWLDGLGYKHGGAAGLMGMDALANGASALVLLGVAFAASRFWRGQPSAKGGEA